MSKESTGNAELQQHNEATQKFIGLANEMKNEGMDMRLISAALMSASGIYATYTAAGNQGFLQASGIEKVSAIYKRNLAYIQERKQEEIKARNESSDDHS